MVIWETKTKHFCFFLLVIEEPVLVEFAMLIFEARVWELWFYVPPTFSSAQL